MTRMRSCWVLLLGLGLMVGATARADAPAFLPIQGTLTDASGNPVEGPVNLRLEIFGSETGGTALWWETQTVDAVDGMVSAYAGSAVPLALELFRDNGVLYLQITVGTSAALPRMQLATTPYAAFAQFADDAGSVGGTTLTGLATSGHNHDDRYFTESELANSGAGGSVHWNNVTNVPAGFADGTDDTGSSYTAGAGITITGTTLAVSQTTVEGWARGVCYDTSAELRGVLDSVYSSLGHAHAWSTITGMPAGFADGTDDGTTYIAGSGLTLTGSTFSVNTTALRSVFDLVYSLLGHAHAWSTITGMPAGFADGIDDGGTAYIAGSGLTLTGSTFSVNTAAIQARVSGTCAAGSSIRVIDAAGGVTCETDDTGSGGSYTAGAGINITGTAISVATGGVTSAMILDGTIASADIQDGTITGVDVADGSLDEGEANAMLFGVVSSTTDEAVYSNWLYDTGGLATARVKIIANGDYARGRHGGGAGTATVQYSGTTIATFSLNGGIYRSGTYVSPSFAVGSGGYIDVLVRANAAAAPVVVKQIEVMFGH